MTLDDPCRQLKKCGSLEIHFTNESDDQRVFAQRKFRQTVQEDQAVGKNRQAVRVQVQHLQLLQFANAV